jgi:hypothetical protein
LSASKEVFREGMLGKDKDNLDILTDEDTKRLKKDRNTQVFFIFGKQQGNKSEKAPVLFPFMTCCHVI